MSEPLYRPEPKSGCRPIEGPMKVMMAAELGSTADVEMSWFHALPAGKGRKPFRLAPWPRLMLLQALELLPPLPGPVPPLLALEPPPTLQPAINSKRSRMNVNTIFVRMGATIVAQRQSRETGQWNSLAQYSGRVPEIPRCADVSRPPAGANHAQNMLRTKLVRH